MTRRRRPCDAGVNKSTLACGGEARTLRSLSPCGRLLAGEGLEAVGLEDLRLLVLEERAGGLVLAEAGAARGVGRESLLLRDRGAALGLGLGGSRVGGEDEGEEARGGGAAADAPEVKKGGWRDAMVSFVNRIARTSDVRRWRRVSSAGVTRRFANPFSREMRSGGIGKYSLGGGGGADGGVHADGGLGSLGHDGGTDESRHGCRVGGGEATRAMWIALLRKSDVSF